PNEPDTDRVATGRVLRILLCSTGKAFREGGPQTNLCEVHLGPSHPRGDEVGRHRYRLWRNASVYRRSRGGIGHFGVLLSRDRQYVVDYATFPGNHFGQSSGGKENCYDFRHLCALDLAE